MGFEFGTVLVFAIVALGFAFGGITASRLVGPRIPNADKSSIYECGERPIGVAWFNFNPRFYLVALVFVIFEVDIALTFPVVAVYRDGSQRARAWRGSRSSSSSSSPRSSSSAWRGSGRTATSSG